MKIPKQTVILAGVIALVLVGVYAMLASKSPTTVDVAEEGGAAAAGGTTIPASGLVTMIDLGATECIPCKMMAPILEEVKQEYENRAEIIFIDVWKNPAQAKKFNIKTIPTQIFFDADGVEKMRHVGFMDKKRIVAILAKLGAS
ncbi:MAG: thioredoxin family protein [Desulfopila sp.]